MSKQRARGASATHLPPLLRRWTSSPPNSFISSSTTHNYSRQGLCNRMTRMQRSRPMSSFIPQRIMPYPRTESFAKSASLKQWPTLQRQSKSRASSQRIRLNQHQLQALRSSVILRVRSFSREKNAYGLSRKGFLVSRRAFA